MVYYRSVLPHSLTHSRTHSRAHSLVGQKAKLSGNIDKYYVVKKAVNTSDIFVGILFPHSLPYLPTHSLTPLLTHLLTHSLTHVGMGKNHPALYCDKFYVHSGNVTWITGIPPPELVASREFQGKYISRYNQVQLTHLLTHLPTYILTHSLVSQWSHA